MDEKKLQLGVAIAGGVLTVFAGICSGICAVLKNTDNLRESEEEGEDAE